jgi:hypothetical protein
VENAHTFCKNSKRSNHFEDLGLDGRIILNVGLYNKTVKTEIGLSYLRVGSKIGSS